MYVLLRFVIDIGTIPIENVCFSTDISQFDFTMFILKWKNTILEWLELKNDPLFFQFASSSNFTVQSKRCEKWLLVLFANHASKPSILFSWFCSFKVLSQLKTFREKGAKFNTNDEIFNKEILMCQKIY